MIGGGKNGKGIFSNVFFPPGLFTVVVSISFMDSQMRSISKKSELSARGEKGNQETLCLSGIKGLDFQESTVRV